MRQYGGLVVAKSVHEAFYLTHHLVNACKVQQLANIPRGPEGLAQVVQAQDSDVEKFFSQSHSDPQRGLVEWRAESRNLESPRPSSSQHGKS